MRFVGFHNLFAEWGTRLVLGGLFVFSGILKVLDLERFRLDVRNYQLLGWLDGVDWLPSWLSEWNAVLFIAFFLPWLEIVAGVALLLRRCYAGGLLIFGILSIAFLGAICSAWARGLDISCGCFGSSTNATDYPGHILLNLVMLLAVSDLAYLERQRLSPIKSAE